MAEMEAPSSLASTAVAAMSSLSFNTSMNATLTTDPNNAAGMLALVGRFVFFLVRIVPGALVWLITFSTITLPTWLFTLFSMSLTFTMNFTTL